MHRRDNRRLTKRLQWLTDGAEENSGTDQTMFKSRHKGWGQSLIQMSARKRLTWPPWWLTPSSIGGKFGYRKSWSWPGLAAIKGMHYRFFFGVCVGGLESVAPEKLAVFQFLRKWYTPSGSGAFRPLYVSLYCSLKVKKAWKLNRTIGIWN